ncbi:MAG: hypothetical protein NW216_15085 [Hyphomicrobium sp.]|nr:hypothetical protein [Hyphomicrobium sp.]
MLDMLNLEHRAQSVITHWAFMHRMTLAIILWAMIIAGGLAIGMAGYAYSEDMPWDDAFLNAAMILSGMGPVSELKTEAGKLFAGCYAIFSGLLIVIATGVVLAPVFHRILHRFHVPVDDGE